jgi:hypothetical protein
MPAVLLAGAALALMLLGIFGANPFWPDGQQVTMAEAAALRDRATVAVMLERGEDPSRPMRVRAGILGRQERQLTAGEAAALADRPEILALLQARGAAIDEAAVRRWACLARAAGNEDTVDYLTARYPEWAQSGCEPSSPGGSGR